MSIYLTYMCMYSSITVTMYCASSLCRLECKLSQRKVCVHSTSRMKLTLPARPSLWCASITVSHLVWCSSVRVYMLQKSAHGQSTLQACQRGGVGAHSCVFALTTKKYMYAYRDSLPSNLLKYRTNIDVQWSHPDLRRSSSNGMQHYQWQYPRP